MLGVILAVTASVQFGVVEIDILNNHINQISVWVYLLTLVGAYMVSEHSIGRMEKIELGAIGLGVGAYVGYEYVDAISTFITQNNPASGVVLVAVTVVAYYFLMNGGSFRYA